MTRAAERLKAWGPVALPALVGAALLASGHGPPWAWALLALAVLAGVALGFAQRRELAERLRAVSSVLAAYRDGDYSIRTQAAGAPLGDVLSEVNRLGDVLRDQRLGAIEAWSLLRKVLAELDVVVLAFDGGERLHLANEAASRLLGRPAEALHGASAAELGLADLLAPGAPRVVRDSAALGTGPWEVRRGAFRLSGEAHTLLVLSDVSVALRDNERDAWRRLIRVMGHEINNSLAPIQSISGSLRASLDRRQEDPEWERDLVDGLDVIGRRAEALGRFMASYAKLARLPPPRRARVDVGALVAKIAAFERGIAVEVHEGPDATLEGDADQLEQVLINLVKNAAEAAEVEGGGVRVRWSRAGSAVEIEVEDDGPGVSDTANLFVPFFTTKPGGSGIGLALSRQIVEAHGGQLSLVSRSGAPGAVARVRLPLLFSPREW